MFEWFLLMTAETGFMMTTLDIPYLELYCVLGHKWCVCAVLMVWHLLQNALINLHLLYLGTGPLAVGYVH